MSEQTENEEAKAKGKPTTITCKPSDSEYEIILRLMKRKGFDSINDALRFCIRKTAEWEM